MDSIRKIIVPIHPEGYRFALAFFVVALGLFWLWQPAGWFGFTLTLWCLYFFRDPDRIVPNDDNLIIAPADGIILPIIMVVPPAELGLGKAKMYRISTFMNVFNVHINRAPAGGVVIRTLYIPGKFFNASLDKASKFNERQLVTMKTDRGDKIGFVQIAGLVARRIVCPLKDGDRLEVGERFGLIRFGSRVDVYLPASLSPQVIEGQTVVAGETVLADAGNTGGQRTGDAV